MIDLNTPLGRSVPAAADVLSVIRPELRIMRASYLGVIDGIRRGEIEADPDLNLTDGGDSSAAGAMFEALRDSAYKSVQSWASDMELVFDKARMVEFIRQALIASESETCDRLPGGLAALEY